LIEGYCETIFSAQINFNYLKTKTTNIKMKIKAVKFT